MTTEQLKEILKANLKGFTYNFPNQFLKTETELTNEEMEKIAKAKLYHSINKPNEIIKINNKTNEKTIYKFTVIEFDNASDDIVKII